MPRSTSRRCLLALPAFAALLVAACGGSNSGAAIGGNLSGLGAGDTVVLQDNASDNLSLGANGTFAFATRLASSTPYTVTVLTQPVGQFCSVANGAGTTDSDADAVNTVSVTCVSTATVGGTVTGLATGTAVTLSNNDVLLPVAVNGQFAFPGLLEVGAPYDVTVATQPAGETCTVVNGVGSIVAGVAVNVTVACSGA